MVPKNPIKMKAIVHMIFSFLSILSERHTSDNAVTIKTPFVTIPTIKSCSAPGKCKIFKNAPTSTKTKLMKKLHVTILPRFISNYLI